MKTIKKQCKQCKQTFDAELREHNRGNAHFCSRKCVGLYKSIHYSSQKPHNTTCDHCGNTFYRSESKQQNSKSGLQFCSRKCKDTAQRIEHGFTEMQPSHYCQDESTMYRDKAFRNFPHKCNRCGYDKHISILQVHHKDRNRKNNKLDNLEILCPNCHYEDHYA